MNIYLSGQFNRDELEAILQAIRDCEQRTFPTKTVHIGVDAPELSLDEVKAVLEAIKPAFSGGIAVFPRRKE